MVPLFAPYLSHTASAFCILSLPAASQEPAQTAWERGDTAHTGDESSPTLGDISQAKNRNAEKMPAKWDLDIDVCRCCGTSITRIGWHSAILCWLSHTLLPPTRSQVPCRDLLGNCAKQMSPSHQWVLCTSLWRYKQILLWARNILSWKEGTEGTAVHKILNNVEKISRETW